GRGRMEKGRHRLSVTAEAYGLTNSGIRRSLASRPPHSRDGSGPGGAADRAGARRVSSNGPIRSPRSLLLGLACCLVPWTNRPRPSGASLDDAIDISEGHDTGCCAAGRKKRPHPRLFSVGAVRANARSSQVLGTQSFAIRWIVHESQIPGGQGVAV